MKVSIDKFNTEIFGIKMGNIQIDDRESISCEDIRTAQKEWINDGFAHVTGHISTDNKKLLNMFLTNGFYIADTLVEYVFYFNKSVLSTVENKVVLRDCTRKDLPAMKSIAKNSFKVDRFHSDQHLDNKLCDRYYEKWIENSYNGFADKVIVAEYNGEPVGFTTAKIYPDEEFGRLVLSAVSDKYRGLGIYTSMIHEGVQWMLKAHGDKKGVSLGTQINTLAVQKAWIKLGFTVMGSSYVVQKYID